jgi:hypothetical protein
MIDIFDNIKMFIISHFYSPTQQKFMFECVRAEVGLSGMGRSALDYKETERPCLQGFQRWLMKEIYPELRKMNRNAFKKAYEEVLGEPFDTNDFMY